MTSDSMDRHTTSSDKSFMTKKSLQWNNVIMMKIWLPVAFGSHFDTSGKVMMPMIVGSLNIQKHNLLNG